MLHSNYLNAGNSKLESLNSKSPTVPSKIWMHTVLVIGLALGMVACTSNSKFNSSLYGPASPRVVEYGEPVPKGGGRQVIGKPYVIAGKKYYPKYEPNYVAEGRSSWYGRTFHGRLTANGEVFDMDGFTAAHPTMPLPSYARVTNLSNGSSLVLRVNDRGPFYANRIVDVSDKVAKVLDFKHKGTTKVKVEYLGPARLEGDDYRTLAQTYNAPGEDKASNSEIAAILDPPIPNPKPVFAGTPIQTANLDSLITNLTDNQSQQELTEVSNSPVPRIKPGSET